MLLWLICFYKSDWCIPRTHGISPKFCFPPFYPRSNAKYKTTESVYPFAFLQIRPLKCRYSYSVHDENLDGMETHLEAMHGWLGSMTVCCTPMVRLGKWQVDFHRPGSGEPEINIDQSKNLLEVERGNDLLAALCISYAFDKALCQPLVTIVGYQEKEHMDDDDDSLDSFDDMERAPPPEFPALMPPQEEEDEPDIAGYLEAPPEEEDEPDIAGYLEAPPEEQDEIAGYLEAPPEDLEQPEVDGYLDAPPADVEQPEVDGFLEAQQPYSDDPENAGYIENQPYSDDAENAGYIENGDGDDDGQMVEAFDDENDGDDDLD